MAKLKHLFPQGTAETKLYVYPKDVNKGEFRVPPRDNRVAHGGGLVANLKEADESAREASQDLPAENKPKGIVLDFSSEPEFKLQLEKLELRQSGIELRSSRMVGKVMHATVFVPEGKVGIFIKKFEAYATLNTQSGKPRHKDLAESISSIRLASLKSFWTDAGAFPEVDDIPQWWEVWLRDVTNPHDVAETFRQRAAAVNVLVGTGEIRFPERRVVLVQTTPAQLASIENLFDLLAELRRAKLLAGEFVNLPPVDQADWVKDALGRIGPPSENAPAVCHLDTGINHGHPLLALATSENEVLAVDDDWNAADQDGHGTAMAGIALYGCLTELLGTEKAESLRHRLESVKIVRVDEANDPKLYGEITSQAVSRIEIAAPERQQRVFCLTVSSDGRDEGYPSSWSGAVDQICAGEGEGDVPRRLMVVAAGNLQREDRHQYPDYNLLQGVEDPSQSWNALTVGAYTEKTIITEPGYEDWQPIAPAGRLSPASRTSRVWQDKAWPLKPDIVMEGGNNAINPATEEADFVDDLSLLTTRLSPTGALLTTTGDTSAATALAARYGAIIWSHYPSLRPESVRGLLVHSARWTDAMLDQFPHAHRHTRLRCYGFGVPRLEKALWSAANAATLIIEDSMQPYDKPDNADGTAGPVKTRDMHFHELPWPAQVLADLGELEVRMRVTLSYFIEPSPGRRGWTRKHRYQSHGLRFDVKRPTETVADFGSRLTRALQEEDEADDAGGDERTWTVGTNLRCKGSLHSDVWTGTAAELAESGGVAVFPVSGWWRERAHLNRWDSAARYSLIVSLETDAEDVDLYAPIAAQVAPVVEIET